MSTTASGPGYPAHDLYVRRFWTAVLGPSAIAELLRIAEAGRRGNRIRRPIHLHNLMEMGLVKVLGGRILIGDLIPPVPGGLIRRLTPSLRSAHERWELPSPFLATPNMTPRLLAESPPASQRQGHRLTNHKADRDSEVGSTG
ncbi:MAG: hypothetical protein WD313_06275, partial [Acidimicrobiia bacterium]